MATDVELLSRQVELMERMNSLLVEQTEKISSLSGAMGGQSGIIRDATTTIQEHNEAVEGMTESVTASESTLSGLSSTFTGFADKMKSFLGEGIFDSFGKGIDMLGINFSSLTSIVSNPLASAMGFIGGIWEKLSEKAAELAKELYGLAQSMEKVREKFGSFNENTSSRTLTAYRNLGDTIKTTSANASQFGRKFALGVAGMEQRLDKVLEIATDLNPVMDLLGQQFNDAADQMYLLKEGLAFSGEALKQTAVLSQLAGKSLKGFSEEIMTTINKIGKNFGVSTKVLGADVGKALSNFKMLGKMTGDYVKEITKAAVFTRKLGIELNELAGLVDKFDEFEGGAEAAAQLAQGFGMVVDPLKMMGMEVGPRLQELQRAFMATGRSIESMGRQERKLLAETAGLTEQQALLAFSSKGMSMSYDEIASGAEGATKQQKTMDQIMNDVLDNIPNIITGFKAATGFIEAFMEGIGAGFGGKLLPTLTYLAQKMQEVFKIGTEVGRMLFDKLFPPDATGKSRPLLDAIMGVGDMFVTIANVIKQLLGYAGKEGVDSAELFSDGIGVIFDSIKKTFGAFFTQINIGEIIANAVKFMADLGLSIVKFLTGPQGIKSIADSLRGAFKKKEGSTTEGGIAGSLLDGVKTAMDTLVEELPKLGPQLLDFGEALIEMLFNFFESFPITSLFIAGGPLLTTIGGIVSKFFSTLGSFFSDPGAAAGAEMGEAGQQMQMGVGEGITNAATTLVDGAGGFLSKLGDVLMDGVQVAALAGGIAVAIGLIGNAVHDVLIMFVEPQGGRDKSFVQLFADAATTLKEVDTGTIAVTAALLGGIVIAIGALVGGLMYATSQIPGGTAGLTVFLAILGTTAATGTLLFIIGELAKGLASIIIEISASFGTEAFVTNVKKLEGVKFDWIVPLIDSIASVVGAIPKINDVVDVTGLEIGQMTTSEMIDLIRRMKDMLLGGPSAGTEVGKGLIGVLTELVNDESVKKFAAIEANLGVDNAKKAITSLTQITTALAAVTGVDDALARAEQLLETDGLIPKAKELAQKLTEFPLVPQAAVDSVARLAESLNSLGPMMTTLIDFGGLTWSINDVNVKINELIGMTGQGLMYRLGTLGQWFNRSFSGEYAVLPAVNSNITMMSSSINAIEAMTEGITSLTNFSNAVENVTTTLTEEKMAQFEGTLSRIVEHVGMINTALKSLDEVRIDTTIDKLGSNMKVAKKVLELAGGRVQVNVQLNLTVNTEKMAQALVLGGFVNPSDDYKRELQADYNDNKRFDGISPEAREDLSSGVTNSFEASRMSGM